MLLSFFNKVAGLKICNFIKKENPTQVFLCKYYEFFKDSFFCKTPPEATLKHLGPQMNVLSTLRLCAQGTIGSALEYESS